MKLNWFSPLPPAKTGIAEFTAGLLPTLSSRADITLWTDQSDWDSTLEQHCVVRQFTPAEIDWTIVNDADVTFYNLGNNHLFHASIWQVSRLHPGVVILHDVSLHNFFDSLYNGVWRDTSGYLDQMEAHYGLEGRRAASEFVNRTVSIEALAERYPLTPLALENSIGAIVHSPSAFEELSRLNQIATVYVPLPAVFGPRFDLADLPSRSDDPPYNLILFGHLGRNRRLDSVFEALEPFHQKHLFHLHIYGASDDSKQLRQRIRSLNLSDVVTLHGYATENHLDAALKKAHLAINLRYPTMGEASASQLRIWSYSLPSLVTQVGWYSSLPEATVAHVRPDHEVEDIQLHLTNFLAARETFERMGRSGHAALMKYHNPEDYVRTVLDLAKNCRQLHLHAVAKRLAERGGNLIAPWTVDPLTDSLRMARQILSLTSH